MEEQRALKAAKKGDLATLEQLLEAGVLGPGITDALGAGLVHHATRAGHLACVKFLVQQAKLPGNQQARNGATPVHDAAATGSLAELRWLVRDGGCGLQVSGNCSRMGAGDRPAVQCPCGPREAGAMSQVCGPCPWALFQGPSCTPHAQLGMLVSAARPPHPKTKTNTQPLRAKAAFYSTAEPAGPFPAPHPRSAWPCQQARPA